MTKQEKEAIEEHFRLLYEEIEALKKRLHVLESMSGIQRLTKSDLTHEQTFMHVTPPGKYS